LEIFERFNPVNGYNKKMNLSVQDKKSIASWSEKATDPLPLGLLTTGDERSAKLKGFAEDLATLAPGLDIKPEKKDGLPALTVGPRITFHAVPLGTELGPFLDTLAETDRPTEMFPPALRKALGALKVPAPLKLFVSPGCPFCPGVARRLIALARENDLISLTVIDGALFPEAAEAEAIRSVPTVLLDEDFRWTGTVNQEEIVDAMVNRDPAKLGATTLRAMMEAGEAGRVAKMMIAAKKIFPALIDLLTHEKWPVRLGAMVTVKILAEAAPGLAARGAGPVWERFAGVDDRIQGDLLHVLGEIAPLAMAAAIEAVEGGPYHEEVREAAAEAVEKIHLRHHTAA
jgi:thiol-disulfide isomerase/thioredoxin